MMSSNVRDGAAMDCYLLAVPDRKMEMVAQNPGIGSFEAAALGREARLGAPDTELAVCEGKDSRRLECSAVEG